jgi:hypothetical protein
MKNYEQSWQRLAAAARSAPVIGDENAPYGFAVSVAAQAFAAPRSNPWNLFEKFAVRGLLAACGLSLVAVALNYSSWSSDREDDVASSDPVTEMLDLSS